MDNKTDPVIIELLKWLKENLPPGADEEAIFRKVRRVSKIFDTLIGLSFEEFYNHAISIQNNQKTDNDRQTVTTLEHNVSGKLKEAKDYISLNEEKQTKTRKLNASRAKLDLKKEQYQLITSIRLDGCMDLISRYNHLISKK